MTIRQRLRGRDSPLATTLGLLLLVPVALALIWYGAMLVALAFKADPETVNTISGYRDAYDFLAGLVPADFTSTVRLITALGGLAAFLLFGLLALKQVPRPYLARGPLTLAGNERGTLTVEPRAIERAAEVAARAHPSVTDATGRYVENGIELEIDVKRARGLPDTLREVQQRVGEALRQHDLPDGPVSVTLAGFDRGRRELE
ncbi:MAG TPA: hypothetical protein VM184_06190 [Gaiellaceae bacterium]|nr:hypothetical protein [Gaiellaceae bacterium]